MENITEGNDKNEIINKKINPVNSSEESNNSDNLNYKTYDNDFDVVEWFKLNFFWNSIFHSSIQNSTILSFHHEVNELG